MNKNLIIAILVVIIIAGVGYVMFSHHATDGKLNTQFNLLSDKTLQNGDQFQFELKDSQGNPVDSQYVKIDFKDSNGNVETFSVITDSNGKAALIIENEDSGSHDITLTYEGNEKYDGCSLKETITVQDGSSDSSSDDSYDSSTASSDTPSNSTSSNNVDPESDLHYDNLTGQYYGDNGKIYGGQLDGMDINYVREHADDPFEGIS